MATWNSRGLRGSTLEELINRTNEKYAESNLALIQKIPTPITPIKIDKEHRHQFQNSHGSLLSSSTYLLNAQSFFPHASHPSITQAAGARLTPITAVTDFDGIIR